MPTASRRPTPLFSAAILALTLHAAHAFAQTPATGPYRIAGHIVSATSGQPLQRATVQILEPKDYKPIASIVTGEDGAFAFANLAAGSYVLEGNITGYIASRYDAHDRYSTAIVTGAGIDTESLALKLTPEAELSGHVTDESGDPVRRANMALYRETRDTGVVRTTRAGNAQTDDTGVYDITHLAPGKYFLSATATPWYAVRPMGLNQNSNQNAAFGVVESIDPSLDVAYPETFYPDATDSSGASPILLKGGDQAERDIRLTPQPAVTITIPRAVENLTPPPPGDRVAQQEYARAMQQSQMQVQLQRKVFDSLEPVGTEMRGGTDIGTNLVGIPPGQYVLKQVNPQTGAASASTTVNLTERSMQIAPPSGADTGSVKVLFRALDGAKLPPQSSFALIGSDTKTAASRPVNEKGETEVKGIDPGEYYFVLLGSHKLYVTSLLSEPEDKPLPGNLVKVTPGTTTSVTVVAGPASASLEGFARTDGKPAAGAMIMLLPADEAERTRYFWKDQSDLDGSFHLTAIPPGRYTLLAIQDGWDIEWQRPEVLAPYLPLATPITIPNTANTTLKLPTPLLVHPR